MIEFFNNNWIFSIYTKSKKSISIDTNTFDVNIDGLDVVHPGEYEKSWILLEVKEYSDILFYSFTVEWMHLVLITSDKFELKEEILSFFGDVDILVIIWTKDSAKIYESIEAKLVIPFWEEKSIFLNTLWQHIEEVNSYKVKSEFSIDSTEFVNLK